MPPTSSNQRLERLTPGQERLLPGIRDEWLRIGLSVEPTDKATAEAAAKRAYECAGLQPPKIIIWLGSPLAGAVGAALLAQVWAQVRDQVRAQVRAQVGDQVWDQVRAQVGDQIYRCGYGLHDANWLAFYDAFGRLGLDVTKLNGLMSLANSCGWWWPFRDGLILTPRPAVLQRDNQHRLHCVDGPALSYPDGWSIYMVHGVRVPEQVVMQPETLTVQQITDERNAEVRRVMLERFGFERYIRESGAKMVHRDDWGTLWQATLEADEALTTVEVLNSTPEPDGSFKNFFLRVPPRMVRARQAVAWTFQVPEDEYLPAVQA